MSGEVVHFEIPADNVERARKFYQETFGWQINAMPEMDYTMVGTTPSDENGRPTQPGSINGGLLKREEPVKCPVVTIRVDDIDSAARAIAKNGGKMTRKKEPIGDGSIGFAAYFKDSEGNVVGLFQAARG